MCIFQNSLELGTHQNFTVAARQRKAAHTGGRALPKLGRGPSAVKKAIFPEQNQLCKEKISRLSFSGFPGFSTPTYLSDHFLASNVK